MAPKTAVMIALMAFIIPSSAISTSLAQNAQLPLEVTTESPIYVQGNSVEITGTAKLLDARPDVTIMVQNPDGNTVHIGQATPAEDGTFSLTLIADGPLWTKSGEYEIRAQYGPQKMVSTFEYKADDPDTAPPVTTPEVPACPQGQVLEDGRCVDEIPTCPSGQIFEDGKCVDEIPTCPAGQIFEDGKCVDEIPTCPAGQIFEDGKCVDEMPTIQCGEGTILVDGVCVLDPSTQPAMPECAAGEILMDGECVPEVPECAAGEVLMDGECVPEVPECAAGEILTDGECVPEPLTCAAGTVLRNGECVPEDNQCMIATAAYGSELAPQVQYLREVRDGILLSTASGTAFMTGFNSIYYSFAPTVADLERESPALREAVRTLMTPMLATLTLMDQAEEGAEESVLGWGILVIALNLGIYVAVPAFAGFKAYGYVKARRLARRTLQAPTPGDYKTC